MPMDKLAKRVWENHYQNSPRARDVCGAMMAKDAYGQKGDEGWEIDLTNPGAFGGMDDVSNLRPLHWMNKEAKGDQDEDSWIPAKGVW